MKVRQDDKSAHKKIGLPDAGGYVLPPMALLEKSPKTDAESIDIIAHRKSVLQGMLDSFQINGTVIGHVSGPRVTRYEISMDGAGKGIVTGLVRAPHQLIAGACVSGKNVCIHSLITKSPVWRVTMKLPDVRAKYLQ